MDISLSTGRKLMVGDVPFPAARALFQALLDEGRGVSINSQSDMLALCKDLLCTSFASKKIEAALWECMKRCTYEGLKIDDKTFEKAEAREDYVEICFEVALEVVRPFTKSLYAQYGRLLDRLQSVLA